MKKLFVTFLFIASSALGGESLFVEADRVNLRPVPDLDSEVLGQVNYGDELRLIEAQGDWVKVEPPKGIEFWVHQDYLHGVVVKAKKLNVRSGPGVNYKTVGQVFRNDELELIGTFSEWKKINPPTGMGVWVSKKYLRMPAGFASDNDPALAEKISREAEAEWLAIDPVQSPPAVPSKKPIAAKKAKASVEKEPLTKPLPLVPLPGQGKTMQRSGYLSMSLFRMGKPSRFRLVRRWGDTEQTVCYVDAEKEELKKYFNKWVTLEGEEYWVKGFARPVMVPEKIKARR